MASDKTPLNGGQDVSGVPVRPARPSLSIDWELYGTYLEECNHSEEEKIAFIETLWSIMVGFVDLGFDLAPVQQVCGQDGDEDQFLAEEIADMVEYDHQSRDPSSCRHAHINSHTEGGECDDNQ